MSSRSLERHGAVAAVLVAAVALAACDREKRAYRDDPPAEEAKDAVALSPLAPGPTPASTPRSAWADEYENNAYHIAQGKRLFAWFNCNGCHANGGGDSGPALMDDKWIYGSAPENVAATIREGRPNGMPAFGGRVPESQIRQLAVYVRALAGLERSDASPQRNDDMHPHPAEGRMPSNTPKDGGTVPPSAERPE